MAYNKPGLGVSIISKKLQTIRWGVWGGGYLDGMLFGRSTGSWSHDIHFGSPHDRVPRLLAPLGPGTTWASTTFTREYHCASLIYYVLYVNAIYLSHERLTSPK